MTYVTFWLGYFVHADNVITAGLPWGVFLTNWTYTLLMIYLSCHCLAAFLFHASAVWHHGCRNYSCCSLARSDEHARMFVTNGSSLGENDGYERILSNLEENIAITASNSPPWYLCLVWVLFSAASSSAVVVSAVFYVALLPQLQGADGLSLENLQVHLLNSVLVLLEHWVTGVPYRLLHVVYPLIYGVIYALFSVVYWAIDHGHVIYPDILDWNKPGPTVGYVLLIGVVLIPLVHGLFFSLYKLRVFIFSRINRPYEYYS